jgi:hypothetical protein
MMYDLILDNTDNDKTLSIKLPIVPRIGDWIRVDYDDEFTEGETLMTVQNVIIAVDQIIIIVTGEK